MSFSTPHCLALRFHSRTLLVAALAAALAPTSAVHAAVKSWSAGNGNWATGGNWSPAGVPGAADDVLIGPHINAANEIVTLNANASVDSLTIIDGMTLRTATGHLVVAGTTQVGGQNIVGPSTFASRLRVEDGVAGVDFSTDNLTVTNFGRATLEDDASVIVQEVATIGADAVLIGHGAVYFGGSTGTVLANDGTIEAGPGGLTLYQTSGGRFDLDGVSGAGALVVNSGGGNGLVFYGDQLTDSFSSSITMGSNSLLEMNFTGGWSAGSASSLLVVGAGNLPTSIVDGSHVNWSGEVDVTGDHGRLRFDADVTLGAATVANVNADDELEFAGATEIQGGDYNLATGAELRFTGDVTVAGGTFSTAGVANNSGRVSFLGPSTWQGAVTLSGRSRVAGMAIVSAATTIDADQFDMDGAGGTTIWDVNAALTVNADQIDEADNQFGGAIEVSGSPTSRLTLNLADPEAAWEMQGTLDLAGGSPLYYTRIAGSRMNFGGSMNVTDSNVAIAAPVTFLSGSLVNLAAAGSDLRFNGETLLQSGVDVNGQGWLHNNAAGAGMTLANGVTFGQAGLDNQSRLIIGDHGPGQAFVDRLTSGADATLQVHVGGTTPGTELSNLTVTGGTAQLDGALAVTLASEGGWTFAPELGDVFTILTAPGGIVGQFDDLIQPVGLPTGMRFVAQYTANSVRLLADDTFAGDFDRDGDVDGADLAVWRTAYGLNDYADANSDGTSDGADFLVWQRQYGLGAPVAMVMAIPEPTTAMLLLVATATMTTVRHRKR
ncbi:PEP-CTERM sorting domain-containing protein [Lacipirellula parvula]|uniref:PEP-CTERM protein-sorting domain-containing protein n=1 Tax=Lacipirellula parvula TaxID=2650471 RepID=A0A5K7XHV4_9BACT|nr:PEP-CTERM sorting domain-containing protein [Lacipirellula parvula]BBO36484.1 hypothetical protein PLANPX_6096 [Lacipirellula parvula]